MFRGGGVAGKTAGAFGLQDQTMALRWVKANIESFGSGQAMMPKEIYMCQTTVWTGAWPCLMEHA